MKKLSVVLALAMVLVLAIGVSVAMAAPGDYAPDTTSGKYTQKLAEGQGTTNTTEWGIDNGVQNANETGENPDGTSATDGTTANYDNTVKNVDGQRTHGEYANNTNSCASCHQTHTAAGRQLLFKNGIYNTCIACHDGTLGVFNVLSASNAGTFGGEPDKAMGNASVHLATGVMKVSAAPGGKRGDTTATTWGKDFTCASCHAPHGSYSDRLLHYNPNGQAQRASTDGGKLMATNPVVAGAGADLGKYFAQKAGVNIAGPFVYGYTYGSPKAYWSQLWYDADGDGVKGAAEHKYPGDLTKSWNDVLEVNYRGGFFTDPDGKLAANDPTTGLPYVLAKLKWDVAPATIVKIGFDPAGTTVLPNGVSVETMVTSYTSGVNAYCEACHYDYNSTSAGSPYGLFSRAFRHKINQGLKTGMIGEAGRMVCLSCHFAHGADNTIQKDARDVAGTSIDVNASSALKRYVNMAICWKCHTDSKAEQLKNNAAYWDKVDAGTAPIH